MKRNVLFFLTAGIVISVIVIVFFVSYLFSQRTPQPNSQNTIIPSPIPLQNNTGTPGNRPVEYNGAKSTQLLNNLKTRQQLSPTGQAAKQKLIASLNSTSGTLHTTNTVALGYLSSTDQFQAEILSANIKSAKEDAVGWMVSQGFTQSDVCKLPLSFYLSPSVMSQLKGTNTVFNPLPEGC